MSLRKNSDSLKLNIEEVTWDKIREEVKLKDQELYEIIEYISPKNDLTFIKAKYPFGKKIIDNGVLHLPLISGDTLPIHSPSMPTNIRKKLDYSPIPLGFMSNKASEVFIENKKQTYPLVLLPAGKLFGLFEITSILNGSISEPRWCVTSGSRFIFMLPDIQDPMGYKRINKELNMNIEPPKSLFDHGKMFSQMSCHDQYIDQWQSEIIFFTNKWFDKKSMDPTWALFYNYLYRYNVLQISRSYKDATFETIWTYSKDLIYSKELTASSYAINTVKHLIAIASGVMPGFCSSEHDDEVAPTSFIKKIFTDVYQLKDYIPTLMHAYHHTKGQLLRPSYYSLSMPTMTSEISGDSQEILQQLTSIKSILNILYSKNKSKKLSLPKSYSLIENVQYKMWFKNADFLDSMTSLISLDNALLSERELFPNRKICMDAEFFNGCIQVFSCLTSDQGVLGENEMIFNAETENFGS